MERSLVLTFSEDYEILLEAFISVTRSIYFEATQKQDEMEYLLRNLEAYNPRNFKSFFDCYVIKRKDEKYAFSNKLVDTIGEEKIKNMELFQKKLKF